MEWKSIRNCGKITEAFKKIPLSDGKIITGEFLNDIMTEFAKVSTNIFDTIGDSAFAYKENQLGSIFLPAFYNLGYGAIQEVPTRRTEQGLESSHGWLDYWVQKDNKWVYLIELKHGWQYLNGKLTKSSKKKISDSIDQLNKIGETEKKNLSLFETTYKISLIVLPVWRNINNNEDIHEDDVYPTNIAELEKTSKNIINGIDNEISWIGIWSLPDRMQYAFQPSHTKRLQTFTGVILVASIIP